VVQEIVDRPRQRKTRTISRDSTPSSESEKERLGINAHAITPSSEPTRKRSRIDITPTQDDSWKLQKLKSIAEDGTKTFARMELALLSDDTEFTKRGLEPPTLLIQDVAAMTQPRRSAVEHNLNIVRATLFEGQIFKPQTGELLVDYYSQLERLNNGERLPVAQVFSPYKKRENNQFFLKDSSVEVLRCAHYQEKKCRRSGNVIEHIPNEKRPKISQSKPLGPEKRIS
jgi:hypothetical protein